MEGIWWKEASRRSKALYRAVRAGNVTWMKFLLWVGASEAARSCIGRTVLHVACECDKRQVVDVLLRYGAEVNAQDFLGNTPLHDACKKLNHGAVVALMRHGAKVSLVTKFSKRTPLHDLADFGTNNAAISIVNALLTYKAFEGSKGMSFESSADLSEVVNMAHILNLQDYKGNTALHLASAKNNKEVVRMFFLRGAKAGVKNDSGMTALHWAVRADAGDVVDVLVDNGEDVDSKDLKGNTPLHTACMKNNKEVIRLLLNVGAKVGVRNNKGMTALQWAVRSCTRDVVQILVNHGEDMSSKDSFGNTPLQVT